jgi:DNA modification methylase
MCDVSPKTVPWGGAARNGTVYYGDNLTVLREQIKDESVDLIYLDPPFKSQRSYNALCKEPGEIGSGAQVQAFEDRWTWDRAAERALAELTAKDRDHPEGLTILMEALLRSLGRNDMTAYLTMMALRLVEMRRVLKAAGSLYLHCDPTASHYLKLILDAIFGIDNFRNEIVWKRTFAHGSALRWGDVHDTLLFYTKSGRYTWNRTSQPYDEAYLSSKYRFQDERGRYRLVVLTAPGSRNGESGRPWRGVDPTRTGRHWAVPRDAIDVLRREGVPIPEGLHEQLDLLLSHGLIRFPAKRDGRAGAPEYKRYLGGDGQPIQDIIMDIPPINSQAQERLGYPTQKPVPLLERIIEASSNAGDVMLDPFCGCGTTIEAAQRLDRRWIGIDIADVAIEAVRERLSAVFPDLASFYHVVRGEPADVASDRRLARCVPRRGA